MWKILKDWFNNFQKSIQKWKFSTILDIPEIIFIFLIYIQSFSVGTLFKKIQAKNFLPKSLNLP